MSNSAEFLVGERKMWKITRKEENMNRVSSQLKCSTREVFMEKKLENYLNIYTKEKL